MLPASGVIRQQGAVAKKLPPGIAIALLVVALLPATASARAFSSKSPLNRPISSSPAIHPKSASMVASLLATGREGGFRVSLRQWSVPVYVARRSTPRVRVRLTADWAPSSVMLRVPMPRRAAPDPEGDGHMAIVDPRRGCEYDFWQASKGPKGWSASWGNRIGTGSKGIFRRGLSARASGFALRAGVIFPQEMKRGRIRHALVFAFPNVKQGGPVSPATQSDGEESGAGAIPMGARLQLRPGLNLRALNLAPWQKTIARALKRYGMFLGDTGGTVALRAVSTQSYSRNPYRGELRSKPTVALPEVLLENMRVLRFGAQRDVRPKLLRNRCAVMR